MYFCVTWHLWVENLSWASSQFSKARVIKRVTSNSFNSWWPDVCWQPHCLPLLLCSRHAGCTSVLWSWPQITAPFAWISCSLTVTLSDIAIHSIFYIIPLKSPTEQEKQKLRYLFVSICSILLVLPCAERTFCCLQQTWGTPTPCGVTTCAPWLGASVSSGRSPPLWATACSLGRQNVQNVPLLRSRAQ